MGLLDDVTLDPLRTFVARHPRANSTEARASTDD
jgi:hypothetical protein